MVAEPGPEPAPAWLTGATTPAEGFRKLLDHLAGDLKAASQAEKLAIFHEGVDAIRRQIGGFAITREWTAAFPGRSEETVVVIAGVRGPKGTPVIAFDEQGRIWTGSLEASVGVTPEGLPVFNAFRANRRC